ncbi:MAG: hypothetical protein EOP48_08820, partial [Sphingobacteriales bacterium]
MNNRLAIFIFTKDRPGTLKRTLASIESVPYSKFIIDDSTNCDNQRSVFKLCEQYTKCHYLGREQFRIFVFQNKIQFPKFNFLLRELGSTEWNLGYARNFALLYSKSIHSDKVLFMDDDIQVLDLKVIEDLLHRINQFQFVGANITGLVDDSILGHIATDLGIFNETMLSGGFMIFDPRTIDQYFLNNYNEDWIWLFLQLRGREYLHIGEVFQELSNQHDSEEKILFQEYGEIALDGILDLFKEKSYDSLIEVSFWLRILSERKEYLNLLSEKAKEKNGATNLQIAELVERHST